MALPTYLVLASHLKTPHPLHMAVCRAEIDSPLKRQGAELLIALMIRRLSSLAELD